MFLPMADDLVQRNSRMLQLEEPKARHVESLLNWIAGNACIARNETEFLQRRDDLASFPRATDDVVPWLEHVLTSLQRFQIVGVHKSSRASD